MEKDYIEAYIRGEVDSSGKPIPVTTNGRPPTDKTNDQEAQQSAIQHFIEELRGQGFTEDEIKTQLNEKS